MEELENVEITEDIIVSTEESAVTTEDIIKDYGSFTDFSYITEVPDNLVKSDFYYLGLKCYNLALMFFWFIVVAWFVDLLFTVFSKIYKRGNN